MLDRGEASLNHLVTEAPFAPGAVRLAPIARLPVLLRRSGPESANAPTTEPDLFRGCTCGC